MGRAGVGQPCFVGETDSRRVSGRAELDHHSQKRDNFRAAFTGFDPDVIAGWGEQEVAALLQDPGTIRHRGKIEATISNAKTWQRIEAAQGFDRFLWDYVRRAIADQFYPQRPGADADSAVAADLKGSEKTGFKFCGPTIVYAFMEAVGMVNDHLVSCPCHAKARALAQKPG